MIATVLEKKYWVCKTCIIYIVNSLLFQASFIGAMAIADLVKTTLGPKGMV